MQKIKIYRIYFCCFCTVWGIPASFKYHYHSIFKKNIVEYRIDQPVTAMQIISVEVTNISQQELL